MCDLSLTCYFIFICTNISISLSNNTSKIYNEMLRHVSRLNKELIGQEHMIPPPVTLLNCTVGRRHPVVNVYA